MFWFYVASVTCVLGMHALCTLVLSFPFSVHTAGADVGSAGPLTVEVGPVHGDVAFMRSFDHLAAARASIV